MIVKYKRNKQAACYSSDSLTTVKKPTKAVYPRGPFASCGDCPYAGHSFLCYGKEGDCIKTHLQRMAERKKLAARESKTEVYAE